MEGAVARATRAPGDDLLGAPVERDPSVLVDVASGVLRIGQVVVGLLLVLPRTGVERPGEQARVVAEPRRVGDATLHEVGAFHAEAVDPVERLGVVSRRTALGILIRTRRDGRGCGHRRGHIFDRVDEPSRRRISFEDGPHLLAHIVEGGQVAPGGTDDLAALAEGACQRLLGGERFELVAAGGRSRIEKDFPLAWMQTGSEGVIGDQGLDLGERDHVARGDGAGPGDGE